MGIRAAATGRLLFDDVTLPAGALLGAGDAEVYRECVQLGRLGWCAVAVGTGQAVLDYVKEYVNERTAFGEPISNRQAVAFMVANIAIELDGMRLATYRAAGRVDQGLSFSREVALAQASRRRARHDDRLRRRPAARWSRLRQGAPGRALVPRPARRRDHGRSAGRLMPINLEVPKKFGGLVSQAHQVAENVFRPNSRKYDLAEHAYPKELDMLAAADRRHERQRRAQWCRRGHGRANGSNGVSKSTDDGSTRNGSNMASLLGVIELCWGDVGLLLTMPRQGLGQAAIAAVADEEQLKRFGGKWAAMAITEPEAGSDSAAIRTTARLDETTGEYVLNGEKIFVTSGDRAELIVVWATLDRKAGRGAIKSFVVERDNPGLKLDRLEHKLGIRASDTANFVLTDCRVPKENLLGSPEIETAKQGFAGVMQTFDNTRPLVAGMALGVARACLERTRELLTEAGVEIDYDVPPHRQTAAASEFIAMESDYEAAYLLTLQAAWMADNKKPNSLQASMAKAKAGRVGTDIALRCVALAGAVGYGEGELLEKWARDVKILDIFEGTQQIQQLVVARLLLGKSSSELR